jgi:hypothetical protein
MRTTVDLDDALFRKAKAHAAMEGIPLKRIVERSLRLLLEKPKAKKRDRDLTIPIFKAKGAKKVHFPPDVANRMDEMEDRERYEASLQR